MDYKTDLQRRRQETDSRPQRGSTLKKSPVYRTDNLDPYRRYSSTERGEIIAKKVRGLRIKISPPVYGTDDLCKRGKYQTSKVILLDYRGMLAILIVRYGSIQAPRIVLKRNKGISIDIVTVVIQFPSQSGHPECDQSALFLHPPCHVIVVLVNKTAWRR